MSSLLQTVAVLICLIMLYGVFREMKKKRMSESKALLWILGVLGLLILSCFPVILMWIAGVLGISWAPAALVFFALIVIMAIIFYHTMTLSQLEAQVTEMAMQIALLKDSTEELSRKLADFQNEGK